MRKEGDFMKIYTKSGDKGQTSIIGGSRVSKDSKRVAAYGTVDELNAQVGMAISLMAAEKEFAFIKNDLVRIQHYLFDLGADLATPDEKFPYKITAESIHWLEQRIDDYSKNLPEIKKFILPGGQMAASQLHICRTVARRAERCSVSLLEEMTNKEAIRFLNRLSDYFFTASRSVNHLKGITDTFYNSERGIFH